MSEAELRTAFEQRKSSLHALGAWVAATITDELERDLGSRPAVDKFFQIPPKPRVKETDSFLEKALVRKPKVDPLSEITDQVGVRFVVLLLEDITRIGRIVESERWIWQKDRDHEQERLTRPDYFAYQSDHYVIRTKEQFDYQGTLIPSGTPCEIQIRTILQHAYAEMAHTSDYKPSIRLPDVQQLQVKRSLAKGSALIETTDDVFKEIKSRLRDYSQSVDALLVRSCAIYEKITGHSCNALTILSELIADTYREQLKAVTPDDLTRWAVQRSWLGERIRSKRDHSVFYRDSVIILVGWLITQYEMDVAKRWPIDGKYLEDLYILLGLSTEGLF